MKRNRKPVSKLPVIAAMMAAWLIMMTLGSSTVMAAGESTNSSNTNSLGIDAEAAILIDAATGQVLYELNADEIRPPASMTKLMTEYIVLEEIKAGRQNWDTVVTASLAAASTPPDGSQIYLAEGDQHPLKDLYVAMAVGSANDATIALADHIAGSEEAFVAKMNEAAKNLGLTTAHFTSATGLLDTTVISARDLAKFSRILLDSHPEFLDYSKISTYKFRERDTDPMVNWNWMLESHKTNPDTPSIAQFSYPGVDGMKTGYISAAGYCFAGTAKQGDLRLISVVMGTDSKEARFRETAKLYNYGFSNFEHKTVVEPKTVVKDAETVKISKGKATTVPVVTKTDVTFLVKKGAEPQIEQKNLTLMSEDELVAPITKEQKVGTVTYAYKDPSTGQSVEQTVDLIATEDVSKAGWFRLMMRGIGDFFSGLFQGIVDLF
ncbi:D-alanyl-D-alanine carboxypeptidase (penicillin-binding protein 5/6) [Paenibacillus phyllosphaerae]|uniref:serine-type D-Ala-D-Ala carboxypeptidase n=1 Tax=Paenibacillus phyllosphaerae TaxID=274593 RepID=A0A7W5B4G2_9BACL|nr:D-alanyl-D-alanine carboxypeptidase family protein [Paenibacillus phyllosphaerae]MBB3113776.1 D-alanyl-D-alanine carboxypeptidase (penicillin-binding protein 5/6) [Paenibacillus phyllosphaerae]